MTPNKCDRYPIERLEVELGLWQGSYQNQTQRWMRWWDRDGNLLPTGWEQTERERERAESERQEKERERERAESERERADRLAAKLRELGIEPD